MVRMPAKNKKPGEEDELDPDALEAVLAEDDVAEEEDEPIEDELTEEVEEDF